MPRSPRLIETTPQENIQRRLVDVEARPPRVVSGGPIGPTGAKGDPGRYAGLLYKYATNTENTDPGSGNFKFNSLTLSSVTSLRISETDADGGAQAAFLTQFDNSTTTGARGILIFRKYQTPSTFAVYSINGALSDNGGWDSLSLSYLTSNGVWSNGNEFYIEFYRTGDKGETGDPGEDGTDGENGKEGPAGSIENTDWKNSVRAATTANIAIATALNNADVLDGVTLATNDRVLVKNQTTKSENGIWVVGAVPARASDANAAGELSGGTSVYVEEGTVNQESLWHIITNGSITPGTTAHDWEASKWKVGCEVTRATNQSVANATDVAIAFSTEVYDNGNCWESGSASKFTVPPGMDGIWAFTCSVRTTGAAANRYLDVRVNGSSNNRIGGGGSNSITQNVFARGQLKGGDYLEVHVYQETGGTIELIKDEFGAGAGILRASFERIR